MSSRKLLQFVVVELTGATAIACAIASILWGLSTIDWTWCLLAGVVVSLMAPGAYWEVFQELLRKEHVSVSDLPVPRR